MSFLRSAAFIGAGLIAIGFMAVPYASVAEDDPVQEQVALSPELERLGDLLVHRLYLMEQVAAAKWQAYGKITDAPREARVIAASKKNAAAAGLDPSTITPFVVAQMDAAKAIQNSATKQWRAGKSFPAPAPSLSGSLRPAISAVTARILDQLLMVQPLLALEGQKEALAAHLAAQLEPLGLGAETADTLVRTAAQIGYGSGDSTPDPDGVLEAVLASGTLRVGTTGDYPPFSIAKGDGFTGIDIDLANSLGQTLGVEVEFVRTTWPTLMQDFEAGKFDIAMSGITRTLARAQKGYFSDAYHSGGKAPIVRCSDVSKFRSLSDLNRPTTRVVVNPGGTNQKFTTKNLYAANVTVFDDNTKIFQEIAANRADVMVTDLIEVLYQAGRNPSLCRAMPGRTLTVAEKGFLMPQDEAWRHYVDTWLVQKTIDGTRDGIFRKYLGGALVGSGG